MSTPLKLKISEILEISHGLPKLDGYFSKGNTVPFEFDENTRWNIGKNIKIIRAETEHWEERRIKKLKEVSPKLMDISAESPEVNEQWREWYQEAVKTIVEVNGLLMLKRAALIGGVALPGADAKAKSPVNPIAGTALANLMPLIIDDVTPAEKPAEPAK